MDVLFGSPEKPTSHSEILDSEKTGEIIEKLKETADIIILDTPPSALLVDAMLVAKYVDEAIYVIMSDYARTSVIAGGLSELKNTGVEICGFVLNGSNSSSGGYGYHSYGYSSHYYGYKENDNNDALDETGTIEITSTAKRETSFAAPQKSSNSDASVVKEPETNDDIIQQRKTTAQIVTQESVNEPDEKESGEPIVPASDGLSKPIEEQQDSVPMHRHMKRTKSRFTRNSLSHREIKE